MVKKQSDNSSETIRKSYNVSIAHKSQFDEKLETVQSGMGYIFIQTANLGNRTRGIKIPLDSKEDMVNGLVSMVKNGVQKILNRNFLIEQQFRYVFNDKGIRVREGNGYYIITAPTNRNVIIDSSEIESFIKDLAKLI